MRFPKDEILAAAFLFERARGNEMGEHELDEIRRLGLGDSDPDLIAKEMVDSVTREEASDPAYRSSVYWALGKRIDRALVPFFKERLALEMKQDLEAAYQIMIALDHLEEPVFSPARSSYSVIDHDLNRADAEAYLNNAG